MQLHTQWLRKIAKKKVTKCAYLPFKYLFLRSFFLYSSLHCRSRERYEGVFLAPLARAYSNYSHSLVSFVIFRSLNFVTYTYHIFYFGYLISRMNNELFHPRRRRVGERRSPSSARNLTRSTLALFCSYSVFPLHRRRALACRSKK